MIFGDCDIYLYLKIGAFFIWQSLMITVYSCNFHSQGFGEPLQQTHVTTKTLIREALRKLQRIADVYELVVETGKFVTVC